MVAKKLIRATGRRKSSTASVILKPGTGKRVINGKDFSEYFTSETQLMVVELPFATLENGDKWDVQVNAKGGGINGQVGATKLGIARALVKVNEEDKTVLKGRGLLTRDAREVERKKYGRKKARKRFQFSKR